MKLHLMLKNQHVATLSGEHMGADWQIHRPELMPLGLEITDTEKLINEQVEELKKYSDNPLIYKHLDKPPTAPDVLDEWLGIMFRLRDQARGEIGKIIEMKYGRWIKSRVLPISQENGKDIYIHGNLPQSQDVMTLKDIALRHYAVSIGDSYWMKPENDTATWETVDPKQVKPSEYLALVGLMGSKGTQLTLEDYKNLYLQARAAQISTIGSFAKGVFKGTDNHIYVLKQNRHMGDPTNINNICEVAAYELLKHTNVYAVCPYFLDNGQGEGLFMKTQVNTVACKLMNDETTDIAMTLSVGLTNAYQLIQDHGLQDQFNQMLIADYLIGNPDRHAGNWGFLFNNDTREVLGLHPLYDHNLAFHPDYYFADRNMQFSAKGRTDQDYATLGMEEAAQQAISQTPFEFIEPLASDFFSRFGQDEARYQQEFLQRCEMLGIPNPMEETST